MPNMPSATARRLPVIEVTMRIGIPTTGGTLLPPRQILFKFTSCIQSQE